MTIVESEVPIQWRLGEYHVPSGRYTDLEFLKLEYERLFPRTWLVACREEEVTKTGQYVEFTVGDDSIIVLRDTRGRLRAYFNACRHRGTRLVRDRGRVGHLRCPNHAWQWSLEGESIFVRDAEDFPALDIASLCLPQCKIDSWGGWVFVNLDVHAEPLHEFLTPLEDWVGPLRMQDMRYKWHKVVKLPCNWKTISDAFSEAYHVPGTHPQLLRPDDMYDTRPASLRMLQEDPSFAPSVAIGHNVVRYGSESRSREGSNARYMSAKRWAAYVEYTAKELRTLFTDRDAAAASSLIGRDVTQAGGLFGAFRAAVRQLALDDGLTWPELEASVYTRSESNYTVFPNFIFLIRRGSVIAYRSRPNGLDPDSCIFDIYGLELFPDGMEPSYRPEYFDDWRDADVGPILLQDVTNVIDVTAGIHSRSYTGAIINPVQEIGVLRRHQVSDEYLFGAAH